MVDLFAQEAKTETRGKFVKFYILLYLLNIMYI